MNYTLPRGIDQFETQTGYIFLDETVQFDATLRRMSVVNPQARILFTTERDVLQDSWKKYKMLNVICQRGSGSFCTFNPFRNETICGSVSDVKEALDQKLDNLMGYPVKVSIFEEHAISRRVKDRYIYRDGELFYLLSHVINFTAEYLTNPDGELFGAKISKKTGHFRPLFVETFSR